MTPRRSSLRYRRGYARHKTIFVDINHINGIRYLQSYIVSDVGISLLGSGSVFILDLGLSSVVIHCAFTAAEYFVGIVMFDAESRSMFFQKARLKRWHVTLFHYFL